jgi:hypothetical protein
MSKLASQEQRDFFQSKREFSTEYRQEFPLAVFVPTSQAGILNMLC